MQKGEGVCVFQNGNTMFRRVTFALATLCLQEKHIFGDTAWAFATQQLNVLGLGLVIKRASKQFM